MKKYWYTVHLSNGSMISHRLSARNKEEASRKAVQQVRRLFYRKKITITSVYVKLARR